jgi:inorganic pyrophosphatase
VKRVSLDKIPAFDQNDGAINAIVETPKGSRGKFKYEGKFGTFSLHSILPLGFTFPYDFGFIPSTEGEDGDPLDILLIVEVPVPTGALIKASLIGVIETEQQEEGGKPIRNDRLIGAANGIREQCAIRSMDDLPPQTIEQIKTFFVDYARQQGKKLTPLNIGNAKAAMKIVKRGLVD